MEEIGAILETGSASAVELAASAASARHCANCRAPLTGRFCAECGQPADAHRRSVGSLTHELVADVVSFDSRILRTAKALLFQPGELAAAFCQGRTQHYVPPVRLYLFVSLVFFLILSASHLALFQFVLHATPMKVVTENGRVYLQSPEGDRNEVSKLYLDHKQHYDFNARVVFFAREGTQHAELSRDARARIDEAVARAKAGQKSGMAGLVNRAVQATLSKLALDPAALNGSLTTWIPRALFLLLPIFALLLAAFYWRQRRRLFFVDHLVFSLGIHSFGFALLLGAAAFAQILPGHVELWTAVGLSGIYLLLAMKRFYGQGWPLTVAKFAAVSLLYVFLFLLPAFAGVIVASVVWG